MYFDGTGDYLSIPDHADWDFFADTTSYTIDFWVKHAAWPTTIVYMTQHEQNNDRSLFMHSSGTGMKFGSLSNGSHLVMTPAGGEIEEYDTDWHHIAMVKNSTTYIVYKDGQAVGSVVDADTDSFSGNLYIGVGWDIAAEWGGFTGYIDEFRISKDIARWTSDFTVY
tara:strand:- start:9 stop:509 length:501 start_codon:yes stop_codon:yes gene_type:complete